MTRRTKRSRTLHVDDDRGPDSRTKRIPVEQADLKITQDVNPSGLGLMPRWMAERIAQAVSGHASKHA
ncbi:MAG: hypothetical protein WB998_06530 [Solirubrobacteraceae bacterium]